MLTHTVRVCPEAKKEGPLVDKELSYGSCNVVEEVKRYRQHLSTKGDGSSSPVVLVVGETANGLDLDSGNGGGDPAGDGIVTGPYGSYKSLGGLSEVSSSSGEYDLFQFKENVSLAEPAVKGNGKEKVILTNEGIGPTFGSPSGKRRGGSCGLKSGSWKKAMRKAD
ncbi:hypothetical protein LWI28_007135 [Acer negundo]|uniref:Uncharacterized protein n=1 Tax=Acer negundo TaxID=4023 RepID=A0AAD5P1B8_ACENE|nr:hypothetical protein LWI28_007135 [Acer negundo]